MAVSEACYRRREQATGIPSYRRMSIGICNTNRSYSVLAGALSRCGSVRFDLEDSAVVSPLCSDVDVCWSDRRHSEPVRHDVINESLNCFCIERVEQLVPPQAIQMNHK